MIIITIIDVFIKAGKGAAKSDLRVDHFVYHLHSYYMNAAENNYNIYLCSGVEVQFTYNGNTQVKYKFLNILLRL